MTSETLSRIAGIALSLAMNYVPGIREWYEKLSSVQKAGVMALLIIGAGVAVFAVSCWGIAPYVECSQQGAWGLLGSVINALIANQATYLIAVRPGRK